MEIDGKPKEVIVEGEDEQPVFYYNRAERIATAPDLVKKKYSGKLQGPPKGLFKALVHTRSSRFMFITLLMTLAVTAFVVFASGGKETAVINEVKIKLTAFSFEDTVYVSLLGVPQSGRSRLPQPFTADVTITAADNTNTQTGKADFKSVSFETEGGIRTTFSDYDIITVSASVAVQDTVKKLECRVEKR